MKTKTPNEPEAFLSVMRHYVALTPDGLYHVQNMVGAMIGQHHVHTEKGYKEWKKDIDKKYFHLETGEFCACGLEPGYVKDHDGRVWFNEKFK
ncbi:MAG: hypothetical protein ABSB22_26100 [Thermodesulfobacteriota bacterium]|jgi:hypothetical protein